MAFTAGYSEQTTFALDGGSAVTLSVTDHTWDEMVEELRTTHTGSGGVTSRIPGVFDGNGSVKANVDTVAYPWAASPGIRSGNKGVITMETGTASPFSIHVMITKIHIQSSNPDGLVNYSFDYALDSTVVAGVTTYTRAT